MSVPSSPTETSAARKLASFAFPKPELSSGVSSVNASMSAPTQQDIAPVHGSETTAQPTAAFTISSTAFQPLDAEWDECSSRKRTQPKQQDSLSEKLAKYLQWFVDPRHALLVWLFLVMQSAVITYCLSKMGMIGTNVQERQEMEYGARQTLYFIVLLKILSLHPSRAMWLYERAFCPEGDRARFDEAFPFASIWPTFTWLILIVTQIAFCAQYFWWASTWIWAEGETPTWAHVLPLVLGLPGLVVAIIQKVLEKKYFRKYPKGADYEDERKIAKALQALPKEWRVAIRVARPGQAPLEFDTLKHVAVSQV